MLVIVPPCQTVLLCRRYERCGSELCASSDSCPTSENVSPLRQHVPPMPGMACGNRCHVAGAGCHNVNGAGVVEIRRLLIVLIMFVGHVVHVLTAHPMQLMQAISCMHPMVPHALLRLPLPRRQRRPIGATPSLLRAALSHLPALFGLFCVVVREMRWALGSRRLRCLQHHSPCSAES